VQISPLGFKQPLLQYAPRNYNLQQFLRTLQDPVLADPLSPPTVLRLGLGSWLTVTVCVVPY
jgi:hypothetical protein